MRRDLLPFALFLLALLVVFRLLVRRRGDRRLRPWQVDVFRRLAHNRYRISPDYPGDRAPLLEAFEESRRLFRDAPPVKAALESVLDGLAVKTEDEILEQRMTNMLQSMARYLHLDADFLTQSIR